MAYHAVDTENRGFNSRVAVVELFSSTSGVTAMDTTNTPSPSGSGSSGTKITKLTSLIECCICTQHLRDTHICRQCSQPFCRECIESWLDKEPKCPHCRHDLTKQTLVKARTIDQMTEEVAEMLDKMEIHEALDRCHVHNREQSFFCLACAEIICERCMFGEAHVEHRNEVVLLESAVDTYKNDTERDMAWITNHATAIKESQDRIQKNKNLLIFEHERINDIICKAFESVSSNFQLEMLKQEEHQVLVDEHNGAIAEILELSSSLEMKDKNTTELGQLLVLKNMIKELRSKQLPTAHRIDVNIENEFTPSPVKVTFRFNKFMKAIEESMNCESTAICPRSGCSWMLKITRDSQKYDVSLLLENGAIGSYWITYGDSPTILYEFQQQQQYVSLAIEDGLDAFEYDAEADTVKMNIKIQRAISYAERCQEQQSCIEDLKARLREYETLLADLLDKKL